MLKNLPNNILLHVVRIINAYLCLCYFPDAWKKAVVISIPKAGKNTRLPGSYRPISRLPTLGKVLEKVFLIRLLPIVERLKLIPNEQFGFRPEHDTVQQAIRLVQKIAEGFADQEDTATVFLDVDRAFNSVWLQGEIFKMMRVLPDVYVH